MSGLTTTAADKRQGPGGRPTVLRPSTSQVSVEYVSVLPRSRKAISRFQGASAGFGGLCGRRDSVEPPASLPLILSPARTTDRSQHCRELGCRDLYQRAALARLFHSEGKS